MIPNKKSSILLVLKVLEEYSDEEHYLTQNEIAKKIKDIYGIDLERKSISSSLALLSELDYDIDEGSRGGYALLSRTFDASEATYLIDAIFSSRSIDGKATQKMTKAISSCFSKYQRKNFSYIYKSSELNRTDSKEVLYNVSIIQEAIEKGKRIGFQYLTYDVNGHKVVRKDGYQYIVSPYYLINNLGRYYLLCNYREKYRPLQTFRLDYMVNIEIKDDWDIKKIEDLKKTPKDFHIAKYINDHIYPFSGDTIEAELELNDEECIQYIKDWFGNNAKLKVKDNKIHTFIKCNENALFYWVMQYSNCIKVISPSSFVDRVKKALKQAISKYE